MGERLSKQLATRLSNELMYVFVCIACDHDGEARHSLLDLKGMIEKAGLGEDWIIAIDDVRADLHSPELHRRAGSILRLYSLAQAALQPEPEDS
jgi:hypothetical protein